MTAILVAGLLLCAGAQPDGEKIQCQDGTWQDKGRGGVKEPL